MSERMTEQDARDLCAGKYTSSGEGPWVAACSVLIEALDAEREAHAETRAGVERLRGEVKRLQDERDEARADAVIVALLTGAPPPDLAARLAAYHTAQKRLSEERLCQHVVSYADPEYGTVFCSECHTHLCLRCAKALPQGVRTFEIFCSDECERLWRHGNRRHVRSARTVG